MKTPSVTSFSVHRRNPGHWDIWVDERRVFCIRGGPGKYIVADKRINKNMYNPPPFKTIGTCMAYICDELMFEIIIIEGEYPTVIESWNV